MQERWNSSALAMELCLSCTNPSLAVELRLSCTNPSIFGNGMRFVSCQVITKAILIYVLPINGSFGTSFIDNWLKKTIYQKEIDTCISPGIFIWAINVWKWTLTYCVWKYHVWIIANIHLRELGQNWKWDKWAQFETIKKLDRSDDAIL